ETGAADHGERARRAEMWRIAWKAAVELIRNVAMLAENGAEGLNGAVRKEQLGLHCANCGIGKRSNERTQPSGPYAGVIVQEYHYAATGRDKAQIAAEGEVEVLPVADQPCI